ncbi:MAG: thioredoxin family protein [Longimicrobiales bacterium]
MISIPTATLLITLTGPLSCGSATATLAVSGDEDLRAAYESGQTYADFHEGADARKELWEQNYGSGSVSAELIERARALPDGYRILAIAVAGCSDSVNTIPYVAHLTQAVEGLDMRIVSSADYHGLMTARPTPDGRGATPTLIILDQDYNEVGCWIERPSPLQEWALGEGQDLGRRDFMQEKMAWYAEDGGQTTVTEVIDIIEAASQGERRCGS